MLLCLVNTALYETGPWRSPYKEGWMLMSLLIAKQALCPYSRVATSTYRKYENNGYNHQEHPKNSRKKQPTTPVDGTRLTSHWQYKIPALHNEPSIIACLVTPLGAAFYALSFALELQQVVSGCS